MKLLNVYEKSDRVYIEYEIDSLIFKNGTIYYKLRNPNTGTYLDNAYTADELIPKGGTDDRQDNTL